MSRTPDDARRWSAQGTKVYLDAVSGLDDTAYSGASLLPGWSRRHLSAHVAANAEALGHLVHWAATNEPTPMYATSEERAAGIARGPGMSAAELDGWLRRSAEGLERAMGALGEEQWMAEVRTAQGRTVPATEIAWLRAREVWVHAVDLGLGVGFADLPEDVLEALCADAAAKRGEVPDVAGSLAERAAWLTGRPHQIVGAPELGPWL